MPGESFYATTPIFYVNDVPHIGHAYTEVAADALARWHRQAGEDTWLLTGTDEHGEKILRTAVANGSSPRAWADELVRTAWLPLLETVEIANDDFIRTTDERHERGVAVFIQKLYDDGHIYAGEYEGFYCVGCEEFKQRDELLLAEAGEFAGQLVCAIHSRPVEVLKEKNYFFRMSAFQSRLLELYESRPDFVQPESVRNEIIQFVRQGLSDLSITRTSFDWGVQVPWDPAHVVYVWFDALLNYITAVGYGVDEAEFARRWPATHIVGKDIARFHAVIWPAMLMAAELEMPKRVFGHGWLLVGGEKMSKSKLTGIAPREITDTFGADAFRYYFLRAIAFGSDGSFSWEDLTARYNSELANGLGNLASRVLTMIQRYSDGVIPSAAGEPTDADRDVRDVERRVTELAHRAMERIAPHEALAVVWDLVDELNCYVQSQQPWVLAKDPADRARLDTVLFTAARGLGTLAVLLSPFMPVATQRLWTALGARGSVAEQNIRRAVEWHGDGPITPLDPPLFPRVEAESDAPREAVSA